MPYFKWRGVDITSTYRIGTCFVPTHSALDQLLIKQEIALLHTKIIAMPRVGHRVTDVALVQMFSQLTVLLHAGVFLADALRSVAEQSRNPYIQEMLYDVLERVHAGSSLSSACMHYPHYFTPLMIHTIHIGQETGALAPALEQLCEQTMLLHNFNKELKSAALMPAITFVFFICIATLIIFGIMPRFVQMLSIKQADLPAVTQFFMRISSDMSLTQGLLFMLVIFLMGIVGKWYYASASGKYQIDRCITRMPLIGNLSMQVWSIYYLRSLSLLIKSGMSLVPAMHSAAHTITNAYVHELTLYMSKEVETGRLLSQAMMHEQHLFGPDIQALVAVGEQSARLSELLLHAAESIHKQVKQQLTFYTQVFQPLLLLIIGVFIAGLIAATYIPILTMSSSLGF